jgi:hypothetical protein
MLVVSDASTFLGRIGQAFSNQMESSGDLENAVKQRGRAICPTQSERISLGSAPDLAGALRMLANVTPRTFMGLLNRAKERRSDLGLEAI